MPKTSKTQAGIYWLASYPRSGNTWTRLFLRHYMKGELDINAVEDLVGGQHGELHWQASTVKPIYLLQGHDRLPLFYAALRNALYMANGADVRFKTHDANVMLPVNGSDNKDGAVRMAPPSITKGAVYLVRDPRDVVCSYAHYKNCPIDEAIDKLADHIGQIGPIDHHAYSWQFLSSWSQHVESWTSDDSACASTLVVRYEDIVADPVTCFTEIVTALGFPDRGEQAVRDAVEATRFEKLRYAEEKHGFDESEHKGECFFRKGRPGAWQHELTAEQADRIANEHGEVMEKFGYGTTNESGSGKTSDRNRGRAEVAEKPVKSGKRQ